MMKLYNANLSPNALRVRAVVNELGIPVEIVDVDLRKGENKTPAYLALNPNGKVPVLVDGDFVLWESRAIDAYLAATKPESGLYPTDLRKRALVDQWSYWQAVHLAPAIQRVVFERLLKKRFGAGEPDETAIEPQLKDCAQFLPVLDAGLAGKEWVAGALCIADFAVASTFPYARAAGLPLDDFSNITAWYARMEARPSWQAAVAPVLAFVKG
jgi:glutathione S-transferase